MNPRTDQIDDTTADTTKDTAAGLLDEEFQDEADAGSDDEQGGEIEAAAPVAPSGVGTGAAAVVSAGLGLAALTGTWVGKIASERETLIGQIKAQGGTAAQQISEIYGDAWHTTALVNGVFALLALITAVVVLTRPRRPAWVRAVAVAGAVLGGIGLLLSAGMYADLFLSLPTAA
ncbi:MULTISPECIES: hypothetical protein [Streptomyces]|uniref:hypothetical protein n=1 Tax=Streptomyces TaxID=1883 RepID=UPI0013191A84|nr:MULTISPECIES: hypothetical protein [Streptomyces]QGZ51165.1 hypothetical protein GPZ77_24740 [Streptomyces sp. QHH-9511]